MFFSSSFLFFLLSLHVIVSSTFVVNKLFHNVNNMNKQ